MRRRNNKRGLGMGVPSKNHQGIVGRAFRKLIGLVSESYENNFAIDTTLQVAVDWREGERKIRPDIAFYDFWEERENEKKKKVIIWKDVLFVLEIVDNDGVSYSTDRLRDIFVREPSIIEGFLYNYERNSWTRFSKKDGGMDNPRQTSYSLTFKCDIASVVKTRVQGGKMSRFSQCD